MTTKKDVGLAVKHLRKKADLRQKDLAKKLNPKSVRKETISRIETGKYNYNINLLFQIAEVLNCDISDFFGEKKRTSRIMVFEGTLEDFAEKFKKEE